jgi:histidinol-phosphate phosphatase family protein
MRDYPTTPGHGHGRAVFIDRDGTINIDTHYPHKLSDLIIIPEALTGLKMLSKLPLDIIVISNQAGIALKMYDTRQMSLFNAGIRKKAEWSGARIDAFYYCPHLEKKNLPAGAESCGCSKPSPGMLFEAASDFKINLSQSFVVGDRSCDIAAGKAVNCTTILIKKGVYDREEADVKVNPDYIADDLFQAALKIETILNTIPNYRLQIQNY